MCAMAISRSSRPVHQSIIKEIKSTDSWESDCISIDDNNHRNSSILSINTDVPTGSQNDVNLTNTCCNNNSTSSENIHQKSGLFSTQSPRTQHCKTNKLQQRSHSLDSLSFPPLRLKTTNDSGTGDSVTNLPVETPAGPLHYDMVPVFGQPMPVLMANRYEFDPEKVAEYKARKRPIIGPIFGKPPRPIPDAIPKSSKRNSNESKKSPNFISRLLHPFKSTVTDQTSFKPMIRHHSSQHIPDENY